MAWRAACFATGFRQLLAQGIAHVLEMIRELADFVTAAGLGHGHIILAIGNRPGRAAQLAQRGRISQAPAAIAGQTVSLHTEQPDQRTPAHGARQRIAGVCHRQAIHHFADSLATHL